MFQNRKHRRVIRVTDTTTHGGEVITGSDSWFIDGKPIARMGDLVRCPICLNQAYPIVEGDDQIIQDGRQVAFEGHMTACGAQLISSLKHVSETYADNTVTVPTAANQISQSVFSGASAATVQPAFYGNKSNMQTHTDDSRIPRGIYYPKPETTKQPLTMENTQRWLYYAMNAEDSQIIDAYTYLNYARNTLGLDKNDSNLAAAERYAEGFFGNYGKGAIFAQTILKRVREIPLVGPIFGKNGSPVSDSDFVAIWGGLGVEHRNAYIAKYGQEPRKLDRHMLSR